MAASDGICSLPESSSQPPLFAAGDAGDEGGGVKTSSTVELENTTALRVLVDPTHNKRVLRLFISVRYFRSQTCVCSFFTWLFSLEHAGVCFFFFHVFNILLLSLPKWCRHSAGPVTSWCWWGAERFFSFFFRPGTVRCAPSNVRVGCEGLCRGASTRRGIVDHVKVAKSDS